MDGGERRASIAGILARRVAVVEMFEPFELSYHGLAWWDRRASVDFRASARPENLGEAGLCSDLLASTIGGGGDQVTDHLSSPHYALVGDAAAISIAEQERAGLRDPVELAARRTPLAGKQERSGTEDRDRTHGKPPSGAYRLNAGGREPVPVRVELKGEFLGSYLCHFVGQVRHRPTRAIIWRNNGSRTTDSCPWI